MIRRSRSQCFAMRLALRVALAAAASHVSYALAQGAKPPRAPAAVSVVREGGVEIITSRTVPAAAMAAASAATASTASASDALAASAASDSDARGVARRHAPTNASLPVTHPNSLADDVRGDVRLRANLLNADGTANAQADNSAHQMVNARRANVEADLKDALKAFDDGKRSGAGRETLNRLQTRIRIDLDEIDILTRSQQSGVR